MPRSCQLLLGVSAAVSHAAAEQQFGIIGIGPVKSVVLSKDQPFDYRRSNEWDVFQSPVPADVAWVTHFTKSKEGDSSLTVNADGFQKIIRLPTDEIPESDQDARVQVHKITKEGELKHVALLHVVDHFKDVWDTFREKAKDFMLSNRDDPKSWEQGLKMAWQAARKGWDPDRFHLVVFVDGLGDSKKEHMVKTVWQQGSKETTVERPAQTDIAWYATSVPIGNAGGSKSKFKVIVDNQQNFISPEFEVDGETAWCGMCGSATSDAQVSGKVYMAVFKNLRAARAYNRLVHEGMSELWVSDGRNHWKQEQLIAHCEEASNQGGGAHAEGNRPDDDRMAPSPIQGYNLRDEEPEVGTNIVMIVVVIAIVMIMLAVVLWWYVLLSPSIIVEGTSAMEAPDIHGDEWTMDGLGHQPGETGNDNPAHEDL